MAVAPPDSSSSATPAPRTLPLLSLPNEILALIPQHFANIEDFKEASSTRSTLRAVFSQTDPNTILRLAASSSRIFFRPDPYFLVAATVDQVAAWALRSEDNVRALRRAIRDGVEGLFALCLEVAGLTMQDIRRLHISRFRIFNPVIDVVDRCAGKQWYAVDDFWNGGRSDAETIDCEPGRSLYEMAIYGSLFRSTLEANLRGDLGFDLHTRLDFVKYCIPDWYCRSYKGFEVEMVGPYRNGRDEVMPRMDQYGIRHILKSSTWGREWERVRDEVGPAFDDDVKQEIWENAVQMQGLFGFEMLRPGGAESWKERVIELREKVAMADLRKMKPVEKDVHGEISWGYDEM
ncbi:uncharacterized protein KY384_002312 [Bacidia gigantensis]|uniref:uncharacterized protein n=1 Tax=Bacidia gigantensis TaxID=2732470 RepID=UPI001D050955|nr:uncharacterized protein KY384_002312 [Bacidia gigantensis]KAG8532435.1 hypothetical protein KY384_002312 [Bacidia gigantensis]